MTSAPAAAEPAPSRRKPLTAAQSRVVRRVTSAQRRIDAANAAARKYTDARMDAMVEGRTIDPPVPWIRLAEAAGVSDAYVVREVGAAIKARDQA